MAKIRCPFSGGQVDVTRSGDDEEGDTWICPDCQGDITLDQERLRHTPGGWLTCPVNEGTVFVWTDEDEEFECDECGGTIAVSDNTAEHEPVALIECPAGKGLTSLVFLQEDATYECDHCEASIFVEDGEARHEDIKEIECTEHSGSVVIVPLEGDDSLECPFCGSDIETKEGDAVHRNPQREVTDSSNPRDVFVSYARKDSDLVLPLIDDLQSRGIRAWFDRTGIAGGIPWMTKIVDQIVEAKVILLVGTANAFASDNVTREITIARDENKPILPLFIEPVTMPSNVKYQLAGVQVIHGDGMERDEVMAALLHSLGGFGVRPDSRGTGRRKATSRRKRTPRS